MLHVQQPFPWHAASLASTVVLSAALLAQSGAAARNLAAASLAALMNESCGSNSLHWSLQGIAAFVSPSQDFPGGAGEQLE